VGVVCRDEHGALLGASARVIEGIIEPATLEAWACAEGFTLAQDLNINTVMPATDCLGVSREINEGSLSSYATILKEIKDRRHHFVSSVVVHERRALNVEAHRLAKSDITLEPGCHVWLGKSPGPLLVPLNIVE
jgi:hypothetical protein